MRKGNQGYLLGEADFSDRISVANQEELERDELHEVMNLLYSHDVETEEEKQQEVLKDIERVTGARSVAVTRYGSYEAKLHGRNSMGTIKQGEFERIGIDEDRDAEFRAMQGISADGSHVKSMNTGVASQSHEYAADGTIEGATDDDSGLGYDSCAAASASPYDLEKQRSSGGGGGGGGARLEADRALTASAAHNASTRHIRATNTQSTDDATRKANAQAMKALKFQQMMQAKFGQEVESQLQADDYDDAEERVSIGYDPSEQRVATSSVATVDARGRPISAQQQRARLSAKGMTPAQLMLMEQRQKMTPEEFHTQQIRKR